MPGSEKHGVRERELHDHITDGHAGPCRQALQFLYVRSMCNIWLSVRLSVCLSAWLSVGLPACLTACLCLSVGLSLSVCVLTSLNTEGILTLDAQLTS